MFCALGLLGGLGLGFVGGLVFRSGWPEGWGGGGVAFPLPVRTRSRCSWVASGEGKRRPRAISSSVTCYRGARPSSHMFGYIKTRKFTYNIFKITCKNCVSFSPRIRLATSRVKMYP